MARDDRNRAAFWVIRLGEESHVEHVQKVGEQRCPNDRFPQQLKFLAETLTLSESHLKVLCMQKKVPVNCGSNKDLFNSLNATSSNSEQNSFVNQKENIFYEEYNKNSRVTQRENMFDSHFQSEDKRASQQVFFGFKLGRMDDGFVRKTQSGEETVFARFEHNSVFACAQENWQTIAVVYKVSGETMRVAPLGYAGSRPRIARQTVVIWFRRQGVGFWSN